MGTKINIYIGRRPKPPHFEWDIGPVSERAFLLPQGDSMLQLTDSQQCSVSVRAVNKKGNPAPVQDPSWSSSDDTVVTVQVNSVDPLMALVVAGLPGTAQVNVQADADMGDGVVPIYAVLDVVVVAGQAATLLVSTGPVEEQP